MNIRNLLLAAAAVCGLSVAVNSAFAQGTAFTYQGLLSNSNNLVNGSYDMTFKLFNASSGPAQVGPTVTNLSVGVTNGLFTTIMDFGAQFNGTPYWLEIGVRTNGGGAFSTLTPRQELTPTPYAITAENVDGLVPASQLTGTLPAGVLVGANGGGLTNLNASNLTSGTVPDARLSGNVAFLNANQTFLETNVFTSGGGAGRLIVSNTFIGVDTNAFTGLSFQYDGSFGEGALMSSFNNSGISGQAFLSFYTKSPSQPVSKQMIIDQFGVVSIDQGNSNNGALSGGTHGGAGLTFGTSGGEGIASQRTAGPSQFDLSFYTLSTNRMTILSNGDVGIGTNTPTAQLEVVNSNISTTVTAVLGVADGGSTSDTHPGGLYYSAGGEFAGANGLIGAADTNQFDGFGVIGFAPGAQGRGVFGQASNGGIGVFAEGDGGTGLFATGKTGVSASGTTGDGVDGSSTSGTGVNGVSTGGNGVNGTSSTGIGVSGTSSGGIGVSGAYSGTNGTIAGVQGTTASTSSFANAVYGIVSPTSPGGFSAAVRGQNNGTGGSGIGVYGSHAGSGWGVYGTAVSGIGVNASSTSGIAVDASTSSGTAVFASSSSGSALTIGSGAIHVSGAGLGTSTAAFIHTTTAANIVTANGSRINNPLCNGDSNAVLFVTHNLTPTVLYNNHPVGVYYDGVGWEIFNEDVAPMATNITFNVLIIKN